MKKIKFLATLLAAGALVACNETIEPQGSGENTPTTGEGYVKVSINLPTTSGFTKSNDDFDDGVESEYAVGDENWIIFFDNADNIIRCEKLSTDFGNAGGNQNVTTTSTVVVEQVPLSATQVLVVLNANGLLASTSGEKPTLSVNSVAVWTFSDLLEVLSGEKITVENFTNPYFLMTNAPIADKGGSDSDLSNIKVTTLTPITTYETREEAEAASSDQIYVERAVAKVTISAFPNELDATGSVLDNSPVTLLAWTLDNTNESVKLVRDVTDWAKWKNITNTTSSITDNRFFGTASPHRVYWAIDGNYTEQDRENGLSSINVATATTDDWYKSIENEGNPVPAYCFENTFATTMDNGTLDPQAATTRVLFAVQVSPNIKEDGTAASEGGSRAENFILFGGTTTVYTATTLAAYIKAYTTKQYDVIVNPNISKGKVYTTIESLYSGEDQLFSDGVNTSNAETIFNLLGGNIRYYKDNVMFYSGAYIEHFGDEYTAVQDPIDVEAPKSYLGRYGVVRNNWYELNVLSVGIGSPTIPEDPGDLDEEEAYMNVQINVLSWAKRSQNVDL